MSANARLSKSAATRDCTRATTSQAAAQPAGWPSLRTRETRSVSRRLLIDVAAASRRAAACCWPLSCRSNSSDGASAQAKPDRARTFFLCAERRPLSHLRQEELQKGSIGTGGEDLQAWRAGGRRGWPALPRSSPRVRGCWSGTHTAPRGPGASGLVISDRAPGRRASNCKNASMSSPWPWSRKLSIARVKAFAQHIARKPDRAGGHRLRFWGRGSTPPGRGPDAAQWWPVRGYRNGPAVARNQLSSGAAGGRGPRPRSGRPACRAMGPLP